MASWEEFATAAPKIAEIFVRRHAAAGGLCMLATLRPDGFPRISPMEPRIFAKLSTEFLRLGIASVSTTEVLIDG